MKRAILSVFVAAMALLLATGCSSSDDTGQDAAAPLDQGADTTAPAPDAGAPDLLPGDPSAVSCSAPLAGISDGDAALAAAKAEIAPRRSATLDRLIESLTAALVATDSDPAAVADLGERLGAKAAPFPETGGAAGYLDCPVLATAQPGPTCAELVAPVEAQVGADLDAQQPALTREIDAAHSALTAPARAFVLSWAQRSQRLGLAAGAIVAEHALRAAGVCDKDPNAREVARVLGIKQGWSLAEPYRAWAATQLASCPLDAEAIATAVRDQAELAVTSLVAQQPLCEMADLAPSNQALKEVEATRRAAVDEGIRERATVLHDELLQQLIAP